MPLFGRGKSNIVQQVLHSEWKTNEERDALLNQLRDTSLKAAEAIELLWHKDVGVRQIGLKAFVEVADAKAAKQLVDDMNDKPSHMRTFAMKVFPRLGDDIVRKTIDTLHEDRNTTKQRLGWEIALSLTNELGAKYLVRAVEEAPGAIQVVALQRLLQTKEPAAIYDTLVKAYRSPEERLRAAALEALSTVQDDRVVQLMLDAVANGDATSRQVASDYLQKAAQDRPAELRAAMLQLLSEGEDATRRVAVQILLATGEPRDVILDILNFCKDMVGWLRQRILDTLQTFGDDVLKPAVTLLQHEDDGVRTAALVLVEQFHDPRLVGPVCRMLTDDDWWLRISACDTLGRLKDERAVPHLVKALDDEEVRWAAIDGLAQIGSPTALKPLAQLLRDPRMEVRSEVIRAFGRFTDKRLPPLLKQVIEKDPSSDVRTLAADVLREMNTRLQINEATSESSTAAASASDLTKPLDRLLAKVREEGGSDIHITANDVPFYRVRGELVRVPGMERFNEETAREWVLSSLSERQLSRFKESGELDYCYSIPEVGRYRANAFEQRLGTCATFRVIPNLPPTFADVRLPGRLTELLDYHQGLIVVSGPAASGKSTTLAAIINLINETKPSHIITLEDPIEFVHPVKTALVNQRELDTHTVSFARALRGALRQDPDVIMVGEMRDQETIRMSMEAAETGHLVIATLHTTSAVGTVERLITSFPPEEQGQIRMGLSESLKYVLCQSLIPRKDGNGRVAVFEVLKGTHTIGSLIRDNKLQMVPSMMALGRRVGMQTVDMALADLVEGGLISAETAWLRAEKPETFEPMCDPDFLRENQTVS